MLPVDELDILLSSVSVSSSVSRSVLDGASQLPHPKGATSISSLGRPRNPRGALKKIVLDFLADGRERDLDELLMHVNTKVPYEVKKGVLRTAMMYIRRENLIESRRNGVYQIKEKESSAGTEDSNAIPPSVGQSIEDLIR